MQKDSDMFRDGNTLRVTISECQKMLDDPQEINDLAMRHNIEYNVAWQALEMTLERLVHELLT